MWRSGEEVVALMMADAVFFSEAGYVAGLGDGVTTEVDDARWCGFEQPSDDVFV